MDAVGILLRQKERRGHQPSGLTHAHLSPLNAHLLSAYLSLFPLPIHHVWQCLLTLTSFKPRLSLSLFLSLHRVIFTRDFFSRLFSNLISERFCIIKSGDNFYCIPGFLVVGFSPALCCGRFLTNCFLFLLLHSFSHCAGSADVALWSLWFMEAAAVSFVAPSLPVLHHHVSLPGLTQHLVLEAQDGLTKC